MLYLLVLYIPDRVPYRRAEPALPRAAVAGAVRLLHLPRQLMRPRLEL